jgi:hypothetical protein
VQIQKSISRYVFTFGWVYFLEFLKPKIGGFIIQKRKNIVVIVVKELAWVKMRYKEPQRVLDVRFCHIKKDKIIYCHLKPW